MTITIWHNPRCSKSRQTLQLLRDRGIEPEVVEYLKNPPEVSELHDVLEKLGKKPSELIRKSEAVFKEQSFDSISDEDELAQAMCSYPILIERPIVIKGDKAEIGRPPEAVLSLL